MEQILNLIWLAVAAGSAAVVLPRRRDARTLAALACFAALLFPIISASDDMLADRSLIDAVAAILVLLSLLLGLMAMFRISAETRLLRLRSLPVHSDPRSPPRV